MTGTVTLTPIVLTVSLQNPTGKEWAGWIGEVRDRMGACSIRPKGPGAAAGPACGHRSPCGR